MRISIINVFIVLLFLVGCNIDDEITKDFAHEPVIELDSENGIYTIKVGKELTISPKYEYVDNALYSWTVEGKLISSDPVFKYTWDKEQELYLNLRVDTEGGWAKEELKVQVLKLTPPTISVIVPSKGLKVMQNTDYVITPDFQHDDLEDFQIEWLRDGKSVSTERSYTFHEEELGVYSLTIRASNIDGETIKELDIEVVENMPYAVKFPTPSYAQSTTDRYTFVGRPVFLRPLIEYFDNPQYQWTVDGTNVENATNRIFKFTPEQAGEYIVSVTVTEGSQATTAIDSHNITRVSTSITSTVKVKCVEQIEEDLFREGNASSSTIMNRVYEYTPAPGQFINEPKAEFTGDELTHEAAAEYAFDRLMRKQYVSLGSWGGYIVVGFDHSIVNSDSDYDFSIQANAFNSGAGGSNEPGIVWVMQDVNGNGLPDDEWYELKGSETGKPETKQYYEVTYYKPSGPGQKVVWTDSDGKTDWVDFLGAYHWQDYYYPLWIKKDSYTLVGTHIAARNSQDPSTGFWTNANYEWGYADNWGSDVLAGDSYDGSGQQNGFKISNAIYPDGTPVNLKYIDFIKVQVGVLAKSGWLGEVSTEVFSFEDLTIKK